MKQSTALDWVRQNKEIQDVVVKSLQKEFPIESNKRILKIEDIYLEDNLPTNDSPAIKELKLKRRSYQVPAYGKATLIDKESGKVIDSIPKFKIANIPKLTRWYSMLIDGNEYQTVNQLRLKSGVYTRKKDNGDLESRFNLEKGFNFTMILPPERGIVFLVTRHAKYRVYNILHALGMPDSKIQEAWGLDLFKKNTKGALNTEQADIKQLYKELTREEADYATSVSGLKDYFDSTRVNPDTTKITLGTAYDKVSPESLLATSKKLIEVMRGNEKPDERESLIFKDLYSVEDLTTQYFEKNKEALANKLKFKMDKKDTIREIISSTTYSKPIKSFFTTSDLASTSEQTNPAQIIANAQKVTFMGTGGIGSRHAITTDVRNLHPTHINFIDPLATPESSKAGVNLGLTRDILKDGHEMKTAVRMPDGSRNFISVGEFSGMKIGFSDQYAMIGKTPRAIGRQVKGIYQGKSQMLPAKDIEAWMFSPSNMFSYTTNLIPYMANDSGDRVAMATRMIGQAIPIVGREAPYVQTKWKGEESFQKLVGNFMNPGPGEGWAGTVKSVDDDYVEIKLDKEDPKHGKTVKVGLFDNYPLNQESFIHNTPKVKPGDKVKPNTFLAESNFTKDGVLALGANVNVAYMPWKGLTFEDSAVVSESFTKQYTSEKIVQKNVFLNNKLDVMDLAKFRAIFPDVLSPANAKKMSADGLIKKGTIIEPGEILAAYLSEVDLSDEEKILRQMNRGIAKPYSKRILEWEDDNPGEVLYVTKAGRHIDIHVKVKSPMMVGDKLAGLHGNKAIISQIVPDDEMPHTKGGERMDMIFSPVTVPGRMNIGQIAEAAAGKLVAKTDGKPLLIDNFTDKDQLNKIRDELQKNKIPVEETMLDGKDGKAFGQKIFWGKPYILKLRHVVDHKLKSRNIGSYDINMQPSRGKDSGQTMGNMEVMSMLSHGAKANMWEATALKGQENDEYWRALQLGLPTPVPKQNFAFEKMIAYMKQSGVNVEKEGDKLTVMPMTDKEVSKISNGKVTDGGQMLIAKNLKTIKGGLFDPGIFGGAGGKKWGHIELAEKIPNPMMEDAIVKVLDITKPKFEAIISEKDTIAGTTGLKAIEKALKELDSTKEIKRLKAELVTAPEQKVNVLNKRIRYLESLKRLNLTPSDYMIKKVPILPPLYRPIYPLPSGDLMISPINKHYRDVSLINDSVKKVKTADLDDEFNITNRVTLYKSVKALQGLIDPVTYSQEKYEGAIKALAGPAPKHGYIQDKLFSKKQDMSARSTVGLDPSLGIDEVGLPDDMVKKLFKPFVMKKLVQSGIGAVEATKQIRDWTPTADAALNMVIGERPVLMNRAPSLHKHSIQAFKVKRAPGKTIKTNPMINAGFNLDYDGDTMAVHVPIGVDAVNEAWGMMPSKNIFRHGDGSVVPELAQEYQFGLYFLTKAGKDTKKTFKSLTEAKAAKLDYTDQFTLNGRKTTIGKELINSTIPVKYRNYKDAFSKKIVNGIMTQIAKESPNDFPGVMNSFKDLGHRFAHTRSSTTSLSDFTGSRKYRDDILKVYQEKVDATKDKGKKIQLWLEATDKVRTAQNKQYEGKNNIYDWLESGGLSGSKAPNVSQILSMPGVVTDVRGRPIDVPILKSYGEGLDAADYWNTMYGTRKGIVDTAVSTSAPGALTKALIGNVWGTLITKDDCDTRKYLEIEVKGNEKDIIDRCLAEGVSGVGNRDDVINGFVYNRLKSGNIKAVKVRSPLTCSAVDGLCQKCYGVMPSGQFPELGYNVGVADAHAVTEKSTQLVLRTKHTGAAFAGREDAATVGGFERLVQLLEVPAVVPNKAILAPQAGTVKALHPDALGGWDVTINKNIVNVPSGKKLLIAKGSTVNKGDKLSYGSIKPQELADLKGHQAAQQQIIEELDEIYGNSYHKRTFETVLRSISSNARITESAKDSTYLRGDVTSIQAIDELNKERKSNDLAPIKFKPYFKSIQVLPQDNESWLDRVGTSRIIQAIREGAATGAASNIHGVSPIPGYLYGTEFGKSKKPGEFY
ncbi:MAG: hypothetical protein H8D23_20300 [Candidatus Brocadiales bacterium]|nr:hypothetical protein [Candidatus Brocadiales bacterium]